MKRSDLVSPAARLEDALRKLEQSWADANQQWDDPVSHRIDEEFMRPLRSQIRSLLDASTKLAGVIQTAEVECTHPKEQRFSG